MREAAGALTLVGNDSAGLVTACRRVMAQQPSAAALVYLCARMLASDQPRAEAYAVVGELEDDATDKELAFGLPEEARVCVLGAPDLTGRALRRRGDVEALVVDVFGEGSSLARRLQTGTARSYDPYDAYDPYDEDDDDGDPYGDQPRYGDAFGLQDTNAGVAVDVPVAGLGAAAADATLVVLEALAIGPAAFLGVSGSRAAAAVAHHAGTPVWLVGGVGRVLPGRMWDGLLGRLDDGSGTGFDTDEEIVPLDLITGVVGPTGLVSVAEALATAACPIVPELF